MKKTLFSFSLRANGKHKIAAEILTFLIAFVIP